MQTIKPDVLINQTLTALIIDAGKMFQVSSSDQKKDISYIKNRLCCESSGFATHTLPLFGKHFDVCLQNGKFTPFPAFKKQRKGPLPSFLKGLVKYVFANDGTLLQSADTDVIRIIRQISFMYYKLEMPIGQEAVNRAISNYIDVEKGNTDVNPYSLDRFGHVYVASKIIKNIFSGFDPRDIIPRTGPGQCADGTKHWYRYQPGVKYTKIDSVLPYSYYYYTNAHHLLERKNAFMNLPKSDISISRLTFVPKDSRGPRTICMEPHEFMWYQQGVGRQMMDLIESHPLTKGQVNFLDQEVNGRLALSSSISGEYDTLDMKEASDRITTILVEALFDECPRLAEILLACTTDYVQLPDKSIHKKVMYAPMGSALCFPVMSIVHFALAVACVAEATGCNHMAIAKKIFVYGDDIICHHSYTKIIMDTFPLYGLKFNPVKCCIRGNFRESCGIDAFRGINITPQRVKTHTIHKKSPISLLKNLAIFNGLFSRGLWNTAKIFQDRIIEAYGDLPYVSDNSKGIGWTIPRHHLLEANKASLRSPKRLPSDDVPDYQCKGVVCLVTRNQATCSFIGNWEQMLRSHTGNLQSSDFVERGRLKMRRTWIPLSNL